MAMFGGYGGYWWLDSYVMAEIIALATRHFCRRFLNRTNDPCGRQYDQMTQAARSGCANTVEGSTRNATSRETLADAQTHRQKRQAPGPALLGLLQIPRLQRAETL